MVIFTVVDIGNKKIKSRVGRHQISGIVDHLNLLTDLIQFSSEISVVFNLHQQSFPITVNSSEDRSKGKF